MKRILIIFLLPVLLWQPASAQGVLEDASFMEFKAGFLRPKDTASSNLLGLSIGRILDNRLYWGIEFNHLTSSYQQTTTIAEFDSGGISFADKKLELDFRTRIVTILLNLYYESSGYDLSSLFLRASIGGGIQLLWNEENNFVEGVDRTRTFNGYGWQATIGVGLPISDRGRIFVDLVYNYSVLSKKLNDIEAGLPTFREINLTGPGVRAGVNLLGLGF